MIKTHKRVNRGQAVGYTVMSLLGSIAGFKWFDLSYFPTLFGVAILTIGTVIFALKIIVPDY